MYRAITFNYTHLINKGDDTHASRGLVMGFKAFIFDSIYGMVLTKERPGKVGLGLRLAKAPKIGFTVDVPVALWDEMWELLGKDRGVALHDNTLIDFYYFYMLEILNKVFSNGPEPSYTLDIKKWEEFKNGGKFNDPVWADWTLEELKKRWDHRIELN